MRGGKRQSQVCAWTARPGGPEQATQTPVLHVHTGNEGLGALQGVQLLMGRSAWGRPWASQQRPQERREGCCSSPGSMREPCALPATPGWDHWQAGACALQIPEHPHPIGEPLWTQSPRDKDPRPGGAVGV